MPVFLISYNRGTMLQAAIESVRAQSRHVQIIVHDNGSDDPATLAVLDDLEQQGVRLERRGRIATAEELNEVDDTIERFFGDWAEPARYVVSDCDVVLDVTDSTALAVYNEMLDRFRGVECVGPMLRIRDIDPTYPLYAHVMNRHIEQFWHRMPSFVQLATGSVGYIDALIDTTFALHRAGERFRRLKSGIRVYEPYEARHLDWYQNRFSDVSYASTSNAQISHWGNLEQMRLYADTTLQHASFWLVERQSDGRLATSRVSIAAKDTAV